MRSAPSWLAPFQQSWSEVLQTPLASHQGTLQPSLPPVWLELGADNSVRDPAAGVADYQRQYWFRLLNHLQTEFPLTARLMGFWSFNHLGIAYLQKFPPRNYDLQAIQRHFVNYLRDVNQPLVWMQAARIDEARSKVFLAPDYETWHWEDARVSHPALLSLHSAPDWMLIDEDWALMDLCLQLPDLQGEGALPCPEAHAQTQYWLIQRDAQGLIHRCLPQPQAHLYDLLTSHTIHDAVMMLQQECAKQGWTVRPSSVQTWTAQSVAWGLWAKRSL